MRSQFPLYSQVTKKSDVSLLKIGRVMRAKLAY